MNNKKTRISYIFVLFSILLITTILGQLSPISLAGPNIPEENVHNGWHWEVNEGDELYYEVECIISNESTGEVNQMFKDIWIYNITSIENVTLDWHGLNEFSQLNTTQLFYNASSDKLEAYTQSSEFALFGYNDSDTMMKHKYRAGYNGMAFILPLNGSNNLQVDILDDILNETYYYPMGQTTYNQYDHYESNPDENWIYFSNSTDHFFLDGYYYNNGTLKNGTAFLMANMGSGPVHINTTLKRVFDYNITDELEWGVNIGDEIYYDFFEGSDWIGDAEEKRINITDISNIMVEKSKNSFGNNTVQMMFQAVYADIFDWNGTDYELDGSDVILAMANNFYPQYFDSLGSSPSFLYPSNFDREDFEFMWNNDTLRILETPFDEIYYTENSYFESFLKNSTGTTYGHVKVDKSTGLTVSYLVKDEPYIQYYQLKTQTLVDWTLNVGDSFYLKRNGGELEDLRVSIYESHSVFVNMTELVNDYGYMGVPLTVPSEQPELQFFSYLEADFELWDITTESWVWDDYGIIAIANIYWPISPLIFQAGGPPILMPENTVGSDLENLFDMFSPVYDDITYSTDYVMLRNSTLDRALTFNFDPTSGRIIMMHGWMTMPVPGSEWSYASMYPKFNEQLSTGINQFTLQSDFMLDITVDIELNVSIGAPTPQYIYSVIPFNPTNITLPNGTALVFFDQLITNYGLIDGNITFTITFPSSIDLNQTELFFFAFNMSGTNQWDSPPSDFYDAIIYDYESNSITFQTEAWGPNAIISAFAYIDLSQVPGIPGYEPILIFGFTVVALLSIIASTQKRIKK
ncbi:MAG: hypothetical protein ACFFC9_11650 [Promethearchaeota archaeon]